MALLRQLMAGYDPADPDTRPLARPALLETAAGSRHCAALRVCAYAGLGPCRAGDRRGVCRAGCDIARRPRARSIFRTALRRGQGHAPHRHGGGDGAPPRARCSSAAAIRAQQDAARIVEAAARLRPSTTCRRAGRQAPLNAAARRHLRRIRRHPHAGRRARRRTVSTPPATRCSARCGPISALPALTLPLLQSASGLPIGVQLVGRRGNDARLLRTANWLVKTLGKRRRGAAAPAKTTTRRAKTGSSR